jgi:hypothetical protein
MRKLTDERLAIGALIAFAFWIFVALPLIYGPRDDSAPHKCSAKEIENYDFWEKTRCDPVAYFTIWLVSFTGALAISTIGLWIVTWRSGVNQRRDTRILERAYLAVEPASIKPFIYDTKMLGYSTYRNVGHLTARNVRYFSAIEFSKERYRNDFPIGKFWPPEGPGNVLPPGTAMAQAAETQITEAQFSEIQGNQGFMYVWGAARYDDGFGVERHTFFCHTYDYRSARYIPNFLSADNARHHEYGNDAD